MIANTKHIQIERLLDNFGTGYYYILRRFYIDHTGEKTIIGFYKFSCSREAFETAKRILLNLTSDECEQFTL